MASHCVRPSDMPDSHADDAVLILVVCDCTVVGNSGCVIMMVDLVVIVVGDCSSNTDIPGGD